MKRTGCVLVAVALLAACGSGARGAHSTQPAAHHGAAPAPSRGKLLGWYPMAYLAMNRAAPPTQLIMKAPAGITVGRSATIEIQTEPVVNAVWLGITPTRLTSRRRGGAGRMQIATEGCPAASACDRRPLDVLTGTPIPPAPPGGVVTRKGITLQVDTHSVRPGRYDFALPIRYPSSHAARNVLDVKDTLHLRVDVYATAPPSATCTAPDLHLPRAVASTPHRLTDTIALEGGDTRLDPPPPGFEPRVPAARARQLLAGDFSGAGGEATLVLARLSQTLPATQEPDGSLRPLIHDVVAWVLFVQHAAVDANSVSHGPPGPTGLGQTEVTTPPDACYFFEGLSALDATSGKPLGNGGGSEPPDLIHF